MTIRFKWQLSCLITRCSHTYMNCGGIGAQVTTKTEETRNCADSYIFVLCLYEYWIRFFFNNCRPNILCKSTCITCLVEFTWVITGEWECLWGQQSAVQSCLVSNDTETETIKMKLLTTQFMSYINSVSLCPTVPFFDLKSSMKRGVCCTRASEKCASRFILAILLNSANTWKIRIWGGGEEAENQHIK